MQDKLFKELERPSQGRVEKGIGELDLKNWKARQDIITDSLWIIPEREKTSCQTPCLYGVPHREENSRVHAERE